MKKWLKFILIIIVIFISVILLDTIQARIFKHSPFISWKETIEDDDSWVDKGIIIDTYYCTKEKDIITVYWKFKSNKFTCTIDNKKKTEISKEDELVKGLIKKDQILGKTIFRIWPLNRISITK